MASISPVPHQIQVVVDNQPQAPQVPRARTRWYPSLSPGTIRKVVGVIFGIIAGVGLTYCLCTLKLSSHPTSPDHFFDPPSSTVDTTEDGGSCGDGGWFIAGIIGALASVGVCRVLSSYPE